MSRALSTWDARSAVAGFDDFELADLLDPRVTVLAHDIAAMGVSRQLRLASNCRTLAVT
ncbi:LacI family transcriptional regulator [Kibdelosporangium aridum]|uniref:LacI family transcriptional regulator n=1 Tax=Kibdelosporangium aridum TaxID=2030 RepID=A0A1W2E9J2_KIBAR|nr:LacI family transcriptional regulator [Kibdelosporangium aridum]